jgi:choline dehydrogenase
MSRYAQYEYIIVGSGAGGAPLAANLARRGQSVLVLEAGDDQGHNSNTQIPAFHTIVSEDPAVRWEFFVKHFDDEAQAARDPKITWTTPEGFTHVGPDPPHGSKQKGILYPRAATLGGCTMHHAMMTLLPPDDDWLHIQDITDDGTWGAFLDEKVF